MVAADFIAADSMLLYGRKPFNVVFLEWLPSVNKLTLIRTESSVTRPDVCSSKSGENLTSLDQYISRMKPGQKQIYYITGQDKKQLEQSPFLEKLLKKGYEVRSLFLHLMTNINLRFLGCSVMS